MQPSFAPSLELEMLDRVRHIDTLAIPARLDERPVQKKSRRSDERSTFAVFSVPGLFADKHHMRVPRSLAEHGLRGVLAEWASLAGCSFPSQLVEFAGRSAIGANSHGLTKYSTRIQATMARATLPMSM